MDKTRQDFEAWCKSEEMGEFLEVGEDGLYIHGIIRLDYRAFKAARSPEFIKEVESAAVERRLDSLKDADCKGATLKNRREVDIVDDMAQTIVHHMKSWVLSNRRV